MTFCQRDIVEPEDLKPLIDLAIDYFCDIEDSFISVAVFDIESVRFVPSVSKKDNDYCKSRLTQTEYSTTTIQNKKEIRENIEYHFAVAKDCHGKRVLNIDRSLLDEAAKELGLYRPGGDYEGLGDPKKMAELGQHANFKYRITPVLEYSFEEVEKIWNKTTYPDGSWVLKQSEEYKDKFQIRFEITLKIYSIEVGNSYILRKEFTKYFRNGRIVSKSAYIDNTKNRWIIINGH
ncbi:MAG: hypothetical protein AAF487_11885 [Bacteroidota bacterium]